MGEVSVRSLWVLRRLVVVLAAFVAIAVIGGAGAHNALAVNVEGYCNGSKSEDQTCDSATHHLDENGATTEGLGRLCIDENIGGKYTGETCSNSSAAQYPDATGYGRAWEQASKGFIRADVVWE
jgi:hypothetical protein